MRLCLREQQVDISWEKDEAILHSVGSDWQFVEGLRVRNVGFGR